MSSKYQKHLEFQTDKARNDPVTCIGKITREYMKIYIETLRENESKLVNRRFFNENHKLQELTG